MEKKKATQVDGGEYFPSLGGNESLTAPATKISAIAKRKQASTPQDGLKPKKVHVEGQAHDRMIWAGALYGQYVANGNHLLDFTAFAAVLPPLPFDLTLVRMCYAIFQPFIDLAKMKLKAAAEKTSTVKQSASIRRAVNLLNELSTDTAISNHDRGQLAMVTHRMHAVLIDKGPLCIPIFGQQTEQVKADLAKAEELRDGLVSQANKHMNQVVDILKEKLETLEELRKLFGDEK